VAVAAQGVTERSRTAAVPLLRPRPRVAQRAAAVTTRTRTPWGRLAMVAGFALLVPAAPILAPDAPLVATGIGATAAALLVARLGALAWRAERTSDALADVRARHDEARAHHEIVRRQCAALIDELRQQRGSDPLTGLASRAALTAALATTAPSDDASLVLIGLDGFAEINDAHGHAVGDALLVEVANRLRAVLGDARMLARLGGDEFAALFDRHGGVPAANRGLAALRLSYRIGGRDLRLTASAGVAEMSAAEMGAAEMSAAEMGAAEMGAAELAVADLGADALRDADLALETAKSAGGDRTVPFQPRLRDELLRRGTLAADLRYALDRDELTLAYQPVVDLASGRIVAAEALLRWNRDSGQVPPTAFIPIAERTGLIVPIGQWVIGTACAQVRTWHRRYGIAVTVNVSARQLREPGFVDAVLAALGSSGLPGGALVLELTESTLIADTDLPALRRLRAHGVRIAVDDFGTGYSSLSYLVTLPVDILKLDRTFITGGRREMSRRYAITGAVLRLAAVLELATIAEGVETHAQAVALRRLGCPYAQGFRYSPAVAPPDFEALLARPLGPLLG
jgi:diguanylate cyclase